MSGPALSATNGALRGFEINALAARRKRQVKKHPPLLLFEGCRLMYQPDRAFLKSLTEWIESQRKTLEGVKESLKELEGADRLMLILASRNACYHIARTIRGFDSWLQNPMVIGLMPLEMAKEVQEKLYEIMFMLMEFDIKHTSEFVDLLSKLIDEGKLPKILFEKVERKEEGRRLPYMF